MLTKIRSAGRFKKHRPGKTSQDFPRSPAKAKPMVSTHCREASIQRLTEAVQVPTQMSPKARRYPASKSSDYNSNRQLDLSKTKAALPSTRT